VFTGLLAGKSPGEYLYLTAGEAPFLPGGHSLRSGRPPYEQLGREIAFGDLPEGCRRLVVETYRERWNLDRPTA
jgi:hypothetical protein